MKKFYLLIFTGIFMFGLQAQTFNSITSNPLNYTLDDDRYWQSGAAPGDPCNDCIITINSNVTMVSSNQTSSDPADNGNTDLDNVTINGGSLKVMAGVTLTIDTYVQFFNSAITIGSDATTAASVILNGQADLNGTTSVRLANENTSIDVNNDDGEPITGPRTDALGTSAAGIFYVRTPTPAAYDWTLVKLVNGRAGYTFQKYLINCSPNVPAAPNACVIGKLYGPAVLQYDAVNDFWGFGQSVPLPVVLVQFLASKNADGTIKLSWATAQEINSASFDIERSADQGTWEKIGSVTAKGYSSTTANYSFIDQTPLAGNGYYHLKMIDRDGKFKYSKVVAVTSGKDSRPLVVYSNPFSDQIRLKVNVSRTQNLSLTVSDIIGKTYLKQSYNVQAGDNLINLVPPVGTARGMYILHIQGNAYEQTVKLVRQ